MRRAQAAYRALLRCYPAAFREEYGDQMSLVFADQLGDARRSGSRLAPLALWGRALGDACFVAPREHAHVIRQDLRYAFRIMLARPTFTIVAVLSLAFGIGANTAIFSLWHGMLHASLPGVREPHQLLMLTNPDESGSWQGRWEGRTDGPRAWLTYEEFEEMRDHAGSFSGVMAAQSSLNTWQVQFEGSAEAEEEARGRLVSGGFFDVLGVHPAIGRLFTTAEDQAATGHAVISHDYWQRRFNGHPDVVGKSFRIRRSTLTIIGVAPAGFVGETSSQRVDIWLPIRMQPSVIPGGDWLRDTPPDKVMWLHVFGRLKPSVTRVQAEAEVKAIYQASLERFYGPVASGELLRDSLNQPLQVYPGARGASNMRTDFSESLTALLAAVGVLLLIACANLANLLLARGAARQPELALRLSLGASRARVVRQLITESVVLAALGGVAAIAVAYLLHGGLVRMIAESDSRFHMWFGLDPLILVFVGAASVVSALAFGALPAWQVTKLDVGTSLRDHSRGAAGSLRQLRSRRLLVGLQLALSFPLLVGAGLLARTAYNLQRVDLGFPAEGLSVLRINVREAGYEMSNRADLLGALLGELRRIPRVRAASFSELGLFTGSQSISTIEVEGYVPTGDNDRDSALDVVGPGYFSTLGVRMLAGREILESDHGGANRVCVINEAFARKYFDRRNPIGLHITTVDEGRPRSSCQVVGVARDARTSGLRAAVGPRFYIPASHPRARLNSATFLIRTEADAEPVLAPARGAIKHMDAALPISATRTLEQQLAPLTAQDRTTARLAVTFGAVALTLAAIGLYGVLSYGIARRTGEIAIRIALGARPGRVISMILGETAGLVAAGLVVGALLAASASRLLGNQLYGVEPQDPLTLSLALGVLLATSLAAAYLPALRASRLNPIDALRQG
jgi:predicted permease